MRRQLKQGTERRLYSATVSAFGSRWGWRGENTPTACLQDVMDETMQVVADHLWVEKPTGFDDLNVQEGDQVTFSATVVRYQKGYVSHAASRSTGGTNYTLSRIRDVNLIGRDKGLFEEETQTSLPRRPKRKRRRAW